MAVSNRVPACLALRRDLVISQPSPYIGIHVSVCVSVRRSRRAGAYWV